MTYVPVARGFVYLAKVALVAWLGMIEPPSSAM